MKTHNDESTSAQRWRIALLIGISVGSLACIACNTTKGVGEDIEAAGEGLQGVAQDTEDELED